MVRAFRPKPNARAVVQPEPTALWLLVGNLQPLPSPYPLDPFDVHDPARLMQHRRDAAISISTILESKHCDIGGQRRFVIWCLCDLTLRRTMLAENQAGPSFGHTQFCDDMINTSTAAGGA